MLRIDVSTAIAVKPAYPAGGTPGFWAPCDGVSQFGTVLDHHWHNRVQEEICGVIEGAGLALDPANDKQMYAAIVQLLSRAPSPAGQCYLGKSGSNLVLTPYNGNKIRINGSSIVIPDAGVSLPPTGLAPGTTYYVYAYANAGVLQPLEASTTPYVVQAGTGVAVKSGDPSRTLVGMARPAAGPTWVSTDAQCLVASYFNRRPRALLNQFTTERALAVNATPKEINAEIRAEFLLWAGDVVLAAAAASVVINGQYTAYTHLAIDDATTTSVVRSSVDAAGRAVAHGISRNFSGLSEGYHFLSLFGSGSAGATLTWDGGVATAAKSSVTALVLG